ncbi:hypothetical protein SH467x_000527 [Pirellulaceae bacterium SH467]|jgi:hypothetical protein
MARCDQGYLCKVCGEEVEHITDSDLYLRYVLGEVDPELLHLEPDCHLRCIPALAQFIADARFDPVRCDHAFFAKENLDSAYVVSRTQAVTLAYQRLWEIRSERRKPLTVVEYPLPGAVERWK